MFSRHGNQIDCQVVPCLPGELPSGIFVFYNSRGNEREARDDMSVYDMTRSHAGSLAVLSLVMLFPQIALPAAGDASPVRQQPSAPTVFVSTSKNLYRVGETIPVAITNSSRYPVLILGGGFFCTIVELQSRTSSGWATLENCLRESPSTTVTLRAGETMRITVPPKPQARAGSGIVPGTYRFAVTFQAGAALEYESVAYSQPFTIR